MRREHNVGQNYIGWLKSLGCIVYLPLSSDGDLTDRISGQSIQLSGAGSMTFNTTYNAYEIHGSTVANSYVGILNNGLNSNSFPNDNLTVITTIWALTRDNSYMRTASPNSYNSNTVAALSIGYNGSGKTANFPNNWFTGTVVIDHTNQTRTSYRDGELEWTGTEYSPGLPSNWILNGNGLLIGPSDQYRNGALVQYLIKDVYVFNQALDLNTIRTIINYTLSPTTYTTLQYIQCTGTQYIDSGWKPNNNTEIIYSCRQTESYNYNNAQTFFATANSTWNDNAFASSTYRNGSYGWDGVGNAGWGTFTVTVGVDTVFKLNSTGIYKDDVLVRNHSGKVLNQCTKNLLFCAANYNSIVEYGKHRIYSVQIKDNGTLVRNFVPKLRDSDQKPGLYDTINDVFYTNQGTGEFQYA